MPFVPNRLAALGRRREREWRTIQAMMTVYCRDHHRTRSGLCPGCAELADYAHQRLTKCPYGDDKPTCVKCPIHCYKPVCRERVQEVMRYAGPRMLWRRPILALRHLWDERQAPAPDPRRHRAPPAEPHAHVDA